MFMVSQNKKADLQLSKVTEIGLFSNPQEGGHYG